MSAESLEKMESFFMALADRTRLRLLNLMRDGEVCVCFFTEVLGESQPKISRHLAYLRSAGVVEARREGKWMHYRIVRPDDARARDVLDETLAWIAAQPELQDEYERLAQVCCAPIAPVTIRRAPVPEVFASQIQPELPELETFLL